MRSWIGAAVFTLWTGSVCAQSDADEIFFETKIRPVLVEHCFKCHGAQKSSGGLRLDSRASLMRGGHSGAALVVGRPEKSLLIVAIRHMDGAELQMPPGKKLPGHVVADFESWVRRGAIWPARDIPASPAPVRHWAFQPIRKTSPPSDSTGWASNPIDGFVLAKLQQQGLRPVVSAEPRTLLRRLYFDVIGLPPTVAEADAFDAAWRDKPLATVTQWVDRLLASPHYGERWGRHWMDVVRYADTAGDNADYPIPEARLYRDYIIDAFNRDLPYDQFVQEQLAGDLLADHGQRGRFAAQMTATGMLALSRRYATAPYEFWHLTLEDAIDTVGQAFLGMTLRCARCHDHKFDPVTMRDYYGLYGIFDSTQFPWAGGEEFESMKIPRKHFVALVPGNDAAASSKEHAERLRRLKAEIARLDKEQTAAGADARPSIQDSLGRLRRELALAERSGLFPDVPGAYAVRDGKAHDVPIQKRGDPGQPGPVTRRAALAFLPGGDDLLIPPGQSGRLQLAQWITRPDHPLTARLMVNRIWQHHFGRGLVATSSNFGTRGAAPTHPELLDYLAAAFVESGWSVKAIHRLILTSKTWQLSSAFDETNAAKDTGNTLYWRHDRRRLDAEAIRDALLAVSGTLHRHPSGPHPFPPITEWRWTQHNPFKAVYDTPHRSVYLMTQRLQRHPFLALFDGPDTNSTTEQRPVSTVPQQALYLMNSPEMHRVAEAFAHRMLAIDSTDSERIRQAYALCYSRAPDAREAERAERHLAEYVAELTKTAPTDANLVAWSSLARVLLSANEFFYID